MVGFYLLLVFFFFKHNCEVKDKSTISKLKTWPPKLVPLVISWRLCESSLISLSFYFIIINLFIHLAALGLSGGTRDLVPWLGIEPGPPALGVRNFSHWNTREVSLWAFFFITINLFIHLAALGLSGGTRDLVPRLGIEPGPPALGAWSLGYWTTREVLLKWLGPLGSVDITYL